MKLNWEKIWLDDKSGYWYAAKVPFLGWEYIVEDFGFGFWEVGVFLSKTDDEMAQISNKDYKTVKNAKIACEKHLEKTYNNFKKWIESKNITKKKYAYKHSPTKTWVYFLPKRNVIGLCSKNDASLYDDQNELKNKLLKCSFNGDKNYCKNNFLEFKLKVIDYTHDLSINI